MMKKAIFTTSLFLITAISLACSCDYGGNFLRVSQYAKTIVKARVIEHVYHTENGKRFINKDEFIQEKVNNNFDSYYDTGRSIRIEIIELIRGTEQRKIVEIFSSDGADCRADTDLFEKRENIHYVLVYAETASTQITQ